MSSKNNLFDNRNDDDLIVRKPPRSFSCPLSVKNSNIYESRVGSPVYSKKQSIETKTNSEDNDEREIDASPDWLKPGLSLPKFRDRFKYDVKEVEISPKPEEVESAVKTTSYLYVKNKNSSINDEVIEPSLQSMPSMDLFFPVVKSTDRRKTAEGISECPSTIHLYSPEFNFELDVSEEPTDEESSALKNWESWMKRRKQQQEYLCQKTKRKPTALVMNQAENFREVVEDKTLFQYSQIPEPDRWRGSPSFWNAGDRLYHKNMLQEYIRAEMGEEKLNPPGIEFVRIPDVIKAEKQLIETDDIKNVKTWESSQYRKKRSEDLKVQRKKYRPHKVDGSDLVVVGKKIGSTEEMPVENIFSESSINAVPSIFISEEEQRESLGQSTAGSISCCYPKVDIDRKSTVCLAINGIELKCVFNPDTSQLVMADTKINEWPLVFEKKSIKTLGFASLEVENRGTMAIQYRWKMEKLEVSSEIYSNFNITDHSPWFCFDKNPGIFLPGQKYSLNFYHYSSTPGLQVEKWILETVPLLFDPPVEITVILIAVSEQPYNTDDLLAIESYLEKCVKETLIKQIVEELFERALIPREKKIDYRSFFLEEELFQYQNPRHYYHSGAVDKLKMIYSEVLDLLLLEETKQLTCTPLRLQIAIDPSQEWDLSLSSLRKLAKEKMEDPGKKLALCKILELSKALVKPSHSNNKSGGKWHFVYSSLCKVANLIEEDAFYLKSCLQETGVNFDEIFSQRKRLESKPNEPRSSTTRSGTINLDPDLRKLSLYQQSFYIKVYHHLCDAMEEIVTIVESCKIFESKGEIPLIILEEK